MTDRPRSTTSYAAQSTQRAAAARQRLRFTMITVVWVDPATWDRPSMISGAGEHYALGFTPPQKDEEGFLTVFGCAEVLARAADDLGEKDFTRYLAAIQVHLLLHAVEMESPLAPDLIETGVMASQRARHPNLNALYERVSNQARTTP